MPKIDPRRNADGSVSYRVQFRPVPGGRPTREAFATADAAQRFIDLGERIGWAAAQEVRNASTSSAPGIPTLATWFERHLEELSASVTPGTVDGYRREAARTWLPHLGHWPVDQLTRERVTAWVAWQRRQETSRSAAARAKAAEAIKVAKATGEPAPAMPAPRLVSDKTIANAHGLLSSVLSAAGREYALPNVAEGIRLPSDQEREEMTFLTPTEYDALLAATPQWWQPLVAFLAGSGCRWGEATALKVADFNLASYPATVTISRAWKRGEKGGVYLGAPKTRRGRRTVTLDATTVATIRHLIDNQPPEQYAFRGVRGARVHAQNFHPRVWQPAVTAAGIGKTPRVHDLRHSHASWLIAAGVPLPIIQYRLGHESIKTTSDRYGHMLPGAGDVAAAAMGRILGDVTAAPFTGELMP